MAGKKIITTISLFREQLRVLQVLRKGDRFTILHCDRQSATSEEERDISDCLRRMLALLPEQSDESVVLLPKRAAFLRQMSFPSVDPEEIQDMIGLQLVNSTPYPVEDIVYQYLTLEKSGRSMSKVLVMALPKAESQKAGRIAQQAGVQDAKITISSIGIQHWVAYQEKMLKVTRGVATMVIDLNQRYTDICFCHRGILHHSRSILYGTEGLAENADELMRQITLTAEGYHTDQLGPPVEKAIILSSQDEGKKLKEAMEARGMQPVFVINPVQGIDGLQCHPEAMRHLEDMDSIAAGLGIAIRKQGELINLAPVEVHDARRRKEQRHRLVKFLTLSVAVLVLGMAMQWINVHKKKGALQKLKAKVERLSSDASQAQKTIAFVRSYDQRLANRYFFPEVIKQLSDIAPKEISLKNLSISDGNALTLQGYAKSNREINNLQAQLIRSPLFDQVDLKYSTKRRIANMNLMDFKMASRLTEGESP